MIRYTSRDNPTAAAEIALHERQYAIRGESEGMTFLGGDFVEQLANYEDLEMTPDQIRTALRVPHVYDGLEKIMNHYTFEEQLEIFVEECAEATKAVQKYKRYSAADGSRRMKRKLELIEEVADVLIMANQMQTYLGVRDVNAVILAKIKRQLERIKRKETKYKVGDFVRVREWDDMARENQIDGDGDIRFNSGSVFFTEEMRKFCGKVSRIEAIDKTHGCTGYYLAITGEEFIFTDPMLQETWCEQITEE